MKIVTGVVLENNNKNLDNYEVALLDRLRCTVRATKTQVQYSIVQYNVYVPLKHKYSTV